MKCTMKVILLLAAAYLSQGFITPRTFNDVSRLSGVSKISAPMRMATTTDGSSVQLSDEEQKLRGQQITQSTAYKVLDFLFQIPLFNAILFGVFRKQSVEKAEKMGIRWTGMIKDLTDRKDSLVEKYDQLMDKNLKIPDYYFAPIHAYPEGNLCWESAMEEDLWSKLMIAPLFNGATNGDEQMRAVWLEAAGANLKQTPQKALDMGCGTGLSMYMAQDRWPEAQFTGIDLSCYKLAISEDKRLSRGQELADKVKLIYGPAEDTGLEGDSMDLITLCLVNHESPIEVSKALFREAARTLKPGGIFTILDLDRDNLEVLLTNPFVAAVYKQTEPYMPEYLALDIPAALEEAGLQLTQVVQASKSHKAFVCTKA